MRAGVRRWSHEIASSAGFACSRFRGRFASRTIRRSTPALAGFAARQLGGRPFAKVSQSRRASRGSRHGVRTSIGESCGRASCHRLLTAAVRRRRRPVADLAVPPLFMQSVPFLGSRSCRHDEWNRLPFREGASQVLRCRTSPRTEGRKRPAGALQRSPANSRLSSSRLARAGSSACRVRHPAFADVPRRFLFLLLLYDARRHPIVGAGPACLPLLAADHRTGSARTGDRAAGRRGHARWPRSHDRQPRPVLERFQRRATALQARFSEVRSHRASRSARRNRHAGSRVFRASRQRRLHRAGSRRSCCRDHARRSR